MEGKHPMKITTRLILSFLAVSILPLSLLGYVEMQALDRISSLALDESTEALKRLGETAIRQKAEGVARQAALYLEMHPELLTLSSEKLEADETLAAIAVQPVGETGYTAVYDSNGITHFHANPDMVGQDMQELAESLPAFWAIFEASLDGMTVVGYYEWQDADGAVRDKYMSCVPVGDTRLRVAATTYIDEFSRPVRDTEIKITGISQETQRYLFAALVAVGFLSIWVALRLAWGISRPIGHLILAAVALEQGAYRSEELADETSRRDDLGQLARVFDKMAREVQTREARLHHQIEELRIQIDGTKRERQVAAITETEYFRKLREKASDLREAEEPNE